MSRKLLTLQIKKKLFEIVEKTILEPDELHLLKILAKKLEINVKS